MEPLIIHDAAPVVGHEVVIKHSVSAFPQYTPNAAATVISEAEELDLNAELMCTFVVYLGYNYHMVQFGNLLRHLATYPLGRMRTFCAHWFKHGPVYVVSSHELVCSDNARPTSFPSSDGYSSDF